MYYENRFTGMVNEYKTTFASIFNEYKSKCSGNDSSFANWEEQSKDIKEKLSLELSKVQKPRFKSRLQAQVNYWKKNTSTIGNGCDLEKFFYFIDKLNSEEYSEKIFKYNKNYCDEVILELAKEYVRILKYIKTNKERLSKVNDKEFSDAQNRIVNLWLEMQKKCLDGIINDEYEAVIHEVESKV